MSNSDQANTLRQLMKRHQHVESIRKNTNSCTNVVTVASGKGGVGKSVLTANLATLLARSGLRTMMVDGDFGIANLEILLGIQAQATLDQVIDGRATLQEAVLGVEPNLWLMPASSGLMDAREWDDVARMRLLTIFESFPWEMDVILLDTGAGIQDNVLDLHSPLYQSVVVLTPEPTSLADGYGLIKTLRRKRGVQSFNIIVNQVTDAREGQVTYQRLQEVAHKFTDVNMRYLGHCLRDEKMGQAVMKRKILLDWEKGSSSVACLELLSKRMRSEVLASKPVFSRFQDEPAQRAPRNTAGFWQNLLVGEVKV